MARFRLLFVYKLSHKHQSLKSKNMYVCVVYKKCPNQLAVTQMQEKVVEVCML